jgi:hypothetical protein
MKEDKVRSFRGKVKVWIALAMTAVIVMAVVLAVSQQRARSTNDQPLSPAEIARQEGYSMLVLDSKRITPQADARITALLKEHYGARWVTYTVQESQGPVTVYAYPSGDPAFLTTIERSISGLLDDAPSK